MRKVGSCGEFVFVDESAEAVATVDGGGWCVRDAGLLLGRVRRREVQRAVRPMGVVVIGEDTEDTLEVALVHDLLGPTKVQIPPPPPHGKTAWLCGFSTSCVVSLGDTRSQVQQRVGARMENGCGSLFDRRTRSVMKSTGAWPVV